MAKVFVVNNQVKGNVTIAKFSFVFKENYIELEDSHPAVELISQLDGRLGYSILSEEEFAAKFGSKHQEQKAAAQEQPQQAVEAKAEADTNEDSKAENAEEPKESEQEPEEATEKAEDKPEESSRSLKMKLAQEKKRFDTLTSEEDRKKSIEYQKELEKKIKAL